VIALFALLLLTGMPQKWPYVEASRWIIEHLGGIFAVRWLHRAAGVALVTIGQYLRPDADHLPMERYAAPEEFEELGEYARVLGFAHVESGPLVRSSYHAERAIPA